MRRLAALRKRRRFDGKLYDLDYTAERGFWKDFDKRLGQVKERGWNYPSGRQVVSAIWNVQSFVCEEVA